MYHYRAGDILKGREVSHGGKKGIENCYLVILNVVFISREVDYFL